MTEAWAVPPLWRGETVVCVASGPSLTQEQVNFCRGKARMITVNDSYLMAPWADILYFCDPRWWKIHSKNPTFINATALKVTMNAQVAGKNPSYKYVRNAGNKPGFCLKPGDLYTGRNSGYQVVNLAVQLGVSRIVLIGYDMRTVGGKTHWFGDHPWKTKPTIFTTSFVPAFKSAKPAADLLGIELLNATPGSALTSVPMVNLEDAFMDQPTPRDPPNTEVIVFAFDRDLTINTNGGPVPLPWVRKLSQNPNYHVWAVGNQLLKGEAGIPGRDEIRLAYGLGRKNAKKLKPRQDGETKEQRNVRSKLKYLKLLRGISPKKARLVVTDDFDLSAAEGWEYYSPKKFLDAFRSYVVG